MTIEITVMGDVIAVRRNKKTRFHYTQNMTLPTIRRWFALLEKCHQPDNTIWKNRYYWKGQDHA